MDVICRSAFGFEESDMGDDFHKYFGDINSKLNSYVDIFVNIEFQMSLMIES